MIRKITPKIKIVFREKHGKKQVRDNTEKRFA
jgi:hypothetical protein